MSRSNPEWKACLQATVQHWNQRKVSETARAKHQKLTCLILTLSFFSFSALFFWSSNCRKKHEMKRLKHNWMATKVQVKERKWHWHWDHLQQALLFFFILFLASYRVWSISTGERFYTSYWSSFLSCSYNPAVLWSISFCEETKNQLKRSFVLLS